MKAPLERRARGNSPVPPLIRPWTWQHLTSSQLLSGLSAGPMFKWRRYWRASEIGLPDAFCKNTGHFSLSTVSGLSRLVFRERYRENRETISIIKPSGVQRSGNARGDCLIGCSTPNSSIEQWRMVVIVAGYTLFVTSRYDVIFTFASQRFGEVCWHNMHIQGRRSSGRAGEQ